MKMVKNEVTESNPTNLNAKLQILFSFAEQPYLLLSFFQFELTTGVTCKSRIFLRICDIAIRNLNLFVFNSRFIQAISNSLQLNLENAFTTQRY